MTMTETILKDATEQAKAFKAAKWKGVPMRPRNTDMGACAASAARHADKYGETYYVVQTAFGPAISPKADAKATYEMQGGIKIDPDLTVTRRKAG